MIKTFDNCVFSRADLRAINDLNGLEGGPGHHKAAADVKQAATNINLGVKAIIEVKKSNL